MALYSSYKPSFTGVTSLHAGTDTAVSTSTGPVTVWNTSTLQTVTDRGASTSNIMSITNNTSSTSTMTGALIVTGGVGIGGNIYGNSRLWLGDSVVNYSYLTTSTAGIYAGRSINLIDTQATVKIARIHDSNSPSIEFYAVNTNTTIRSRWDWAVSTTGGQDNAAIRWLTSGLTSETGADRIRFFSNTSSVIVSIPSTATSTSTTTGALVVTGGVGVGGSLYATALYDSGYRVLTTATSLVNSLIAGTDVSISAATGNVTVSDISTLQSVTNRGSTTTNVVYINNTSTSFASTTGALVVLGGVGIGGNITTYGTIQAGTQISIKANSLDSLNSSTFFIESTVPVGYSAFTIRNSGVSGQSYTFDLGGNNRALGGGTAINEGNLIIRDDTNSANRMIITKTGNILVNTSTDFGAQLQVNGSVSATTGTFSGPVVIQTSLQETRVTLVNNTSATVVDSFISSIYRSCKCLVQVQDGNDFHITEIVLLHDNIGQVYKSEYGIISTGGEKGLFTADLQGDGIVRLYFTADSSSSKKISIVKTAIAV